MFSSCWSGVKGLDGFLMEEDQIDFVQDDPLPSVCQSHHPSRDFVADPLCQRCQTASGGSRSMPAIFPGAKHRTRACEHFATIVKDWTAFRHVRRWFLGSPTFGALLWPSGI